MTVRNYFCIFAAKMCEPVKTNVCGTMMKRLIQTLFLGLMTMAAMAQLSSNPDKFLGNITTYGQVDDDSSAKFYQLWNQITPENESKWSSVQGRGSTSWNWGGCDNCVNYARDHHFPFKFHTLVWGAQFPEWVKSLGSAALRCHRELDGRRQGPLSEPCYD